MGSFFRMVKMDLYRMIRMKIVLLLFLAAAMLTCIVTIRYAEHINTIRESSYSIETLHKRYSSMIIDAAVNNTKISIWDMSIITFSPLILIFSAAFFIPFFINDESHYGFLKSISCLVPNRGIIAASKLFTITIYSICSTAVVFISSFIFSKLFLGYVYWGSNVTSYIKAFITMFVLYLAVNFLIALISFLCSNVNTIIIIAALVFSGIQSLFSVIINFVLSLKNQNLVLTAGAFFLVLFAVMSIFIMAKKDVK